MSVVHHFMIFSYLLNHFITWVIVLIDSTQNNIETKVFNRYEEFYSYMNYLKDQNIRCSNENQLFDYDLMKETYVIPVKEENRIEEV